MNACKFCASGMERVGCGCAANGGRCAQWGHTTSRGVWVECRAPKVTPSDVSVIKEYGLTQKLSNQVRVF